MFCCKDCGRELEAKILLGDLLCPDCRRNRIEKQKLEFLQEQEEKREREDREREREREREKREREREREREKREREREDREREREREEREREREKRKIFKQQRSPDSIDISFVEDTLRELEKLQEEREKQKKFDAQTFNNLLQLSKLDEVKKARNLLVTQIEKCKKAISSEISSERKKKIRNLHLKYFISTLLLLFAWFVALLVFLREMPILSFLLFLPFPFVLGSVIVGFVKQKKYINKQYDLCEKKTNFSHFISKLNEEGLLSGELKIVNSKPFLMVDGKLQECFLFEKKETSYNECFLENDSYLEKENLSILFAYFEPVGERYYIVPRKDKERVVQWEVENCFIGSKLVEYQYKLYNGKLIKENYIQTHDEKCRDGDRALLFLEFDYDESEDEIVPPKLNLDIFSKANKLVRHAVWRFQKA